MTGSEPKDNHSPPALEQSVPSGGSIGFRRAGLTVLVGSGSGHFIALALTPLISRLYSPDVFGVFASVVAASTVFVGISTFRLEVLAQRSGSEETARGTLALALVSSIAWGALLSAGAVLLAFRSDNVIWLGAGALVTIASLQLVGGAALVRRGDYRRLARANFVQGAGAATTQVALGAVSPTPGGLLAGFALARLIWLQPVASLARGRRRHVSWRSVRPFALTAGPSAFLNSLGGQMTVLLAIAFYGPVGAGLLAMAIRVLVSPLGIVGQAAAAATLGEVGRILRDGDGSVRAVAHRAMRDMLRVGLIPCGLAAALGIALVPRLLAPEWETTGHIVALLSFGTLAQFTISPFSQLLNLLGRSRQLLCWDLGRLVLITLAWTIPALDNQPLVITVGFYSASLVVIYIGLWRLLEWTFVRTGAAS